MHFKGPGCLCVCVQLVEIWGKRRVEEEGGRKGESGIAYADWQSAAIWMQNAQMQNGNGKGQGKKKKEREREREGYGLRYCKKCNKLKKAKLPQLKCKKDIANSSWAYWKCTERRLQWSRGEAERGKGDCVKSTCDILLTWGILILLMPLKLFNVYSLQVGKQFRKGIIAEREREKKFSAKWRYRYSRYSLHRVCPTVYQAYALCAVSSLWQKMINIRVQAKQSRP